MRARLSLLAPACQLARVVLAGLLLAGCTAGTTGRPAPSSGGSSTTGHVSTPAVTGAPTRAPEPTPSAPPAPASGRPASRASTSPASATTTTPAQAGILAGRTFRLDSIRDRAGRTITAPGVDMSLLFDRTGATSLVWTGGTFCGGLRYDKAIASQAGSAGPIRLRKPDSGRACPVGPNVSSDDLAGNLDMTLVDGVLTIDQGATTWIFRPGPYPRTTGPLAGHRYRLVSTWSDIGARKFTDIDLIMSFDDTGATSVVTKGGKPCGSERLDQVVYLGESSGRPNLHLGPPTGRTCPIGADLATPPSSWTFGVGIDGERLAMGGGNSGYFFTRIG